MARPKIQINRKKEILDAARILFAEKSFEKTTMDEIAVKVGISKGSVYLDFKNKEDILVAIVEDNVGFLIQQTEALIKNAKAPYMEVLRKIFEKDVLNVFDMVTSQIHTHVALISTSYYIRERLQPIVQKIFSHIASVLEKAAKNGEIQSHEDYYNLAQIIHTCMQGYLPPYDLKYSPSYRKDISKEEIRKILMKDASVAIEIIISGVKTAKYNTKNNLEILNNK
jgi:TetR/AcrR family fatty acid metabolism transcriptional regulator